MSSSVGAPRLFGGLLVFTGLFTLGLSLVARDRRLSRQFAKLDNTGPVDNMDDSWWWSSSQIGSSVVEAQLLSDPKRSEDENPSFVTEYEYSNSNNLNRLELTFENKFKEDANDSGKNDGTMETSGQNKAGKTDAKDSQLSSKAILVPLPCAVGQLPDPLGMCRDIM